MKKKNDLKYALTLLKERTGWSYEKMCRMMCIVMNEDGVSHTTLYRIIHGVHAPHNTTRMWVRNAIEAVTKDEVGQGRMTIMTASSIMTLLPKKVDQ